MLTPKVSGLDCVKIRKTCAQRNPLLCFCVSGCSGKAFWVGRRQRRWHETENHLWELVVRGYSQCRGKGRMYGLALYTVYDLSILQTISLTCLQACRDLTGRDFSGPCASWSVASGSSWEGPLSLLSGSGVSFPKRPTWPDLIAELL